ncbi:MAG: HK97 gp10 family phage protein [Methylobacterium sp.]|nr:HK97 gp10 family phage protein [Methylobacterium sp.]
MGGLDDFAKRMARISVRVEENVERAVKDVSREVARAAIEATPVDTGMARSNWQTGLDAAPLGVLPARIPGAKGSTGDANSAAAMFACEPAIEDFDVTKNREVHITNNAPHIGALNDGHSKQAPADFARLAVLAGLGKIRRARILPD